MSLERIYADITDLYYNECINLACCCLVKSFIQSGMRSKITFSVVDIKTSLQAELCCISVV